MFYLQIRFEKLTFALFGLYFDSISPCDDDAVCYPMCMSKLGSRLISLLYIETDRRVMLVAATRE